MDVAAIAKEGRIAHLYAIADREITQMTGVVFCVDG
jgi:hypothetical protein